MRSVPYHCTDTLAHYYLEDSYVLAIHIFPSKIAFEVDAILTEDHADYAAPPQNEKYCYRRVQIVFDEVTSIEEFTLSFFSATDATGEKDMGNIDSLTLRDGRVYEIFGPWGRMSIIANILEVAAL